MLVADVEFLVSQDKGHLSLYYGFEIPYNDMNMSLKYIFNTARQ